MTYAPTPPEPPKPPQYMSYISGRSPAFKTHKQRNHLTSALGSYIRAVPGATAPQMWAYELKDSKYELMWDIQSGTKIEDLPWSKTVHRPWTPSHVECKCSTCQNNQ